MTPAQARSRLASLPGAVAARVASSLEGAAVAVAAEARRMLAAGRQPSGPGQTPRDRDGVLSGAIDTGRDPTTGAAVVTVATPYAADLEYGTTRMAARPFLRPAVEHAASDICDTLAAGVSRAISDALRSA